MLIGRGGCWPAPSDWLEGRPLRPKVASTVSRLQLLASMHKSSNSTHLPHQDLTSVVELLHQPTSKHTALPSLPLRGDG